MIRRMVCVRCHVLAFWVITGVIAFPNGLLAEAYVHSSIVPPVPAREMRAAWIATVANIDWPSTNNLSSSQQKRELLTLINRAAELKLNTLIFQVRPSCDAMYPSRIEPWSEYLTGTMGKAPDPYYDPLKLAIAEAHKRGIELHAWFNPYRARHALAKGPVAAGSIIRTHPNLVRRYGKSLWLDPGEKEVQQYSLSVIMDVVRRYDIDGVHLDDYFYPYKELTADGKNLEFPDESSWRRFGAAGKLSRDDWRRQNVNEFIHQVYESIKAVKPWVKFGISPFGIWRPGNPAQIKGFDPYSELYADSRLWLASGWLDYFSPQLYWAISPPEQSFPVLLKWWADQNHKQRLLVPGLNTAKVGGAWAPEEILRQIRLVRQQPGTSGHIHWDIKALLRNQALFEDLRRELYTQPALVPAMPWLDRSPPSRPVLMVRNSHAAWNSGGAQKPWLWVLQTGTSGHWTTQVLPDWQKECALPEPLPAVVALSAVDRYGNLSPGTVLQRNPGQTRMSRLHKKD